MLGYRYVGSFVPRDHSSLFEALAQGLSALRKNEWVEGIEERFGFVKVSVADVRVEHQVKIADFMKWLERPGAHTTGNHASPQNPGNSRNVCVQVMSRLAGMFLHHRAGLRPTLTQFVKRTGTGGIAARGAAIRSTPERSLFAVEEVRRPFPYPPNDTDKSSLDVFSRFLWRSRMLRAAVDTRCTRLFRRVAACSCSSPFTLYAARAAIWTISSSIWCFSQQLISSPTKRSA